MLIQSSIHLYLIIYECESFTLYANSPLSIFMTLLFRGFTNIVYDVEKF